MNNHWVFEFDDYRKALAFQVKSEDKGRGYRTILARAAGCQPAYLSQILAGSVHMTPDQASGLCDFWQLSETESDYFLTLVHLARSGQQSLKVRLKRKLQKLIEQHEGEKASGVQIEKETYNRENVLSYYLDWVPSAVHVCLMLPDCDHPAAIGRRLKIDDGTALLALKVLESLRIAKKVNSSWRLTAKTLHASDESLFAPHHHRNWREKSIEYFRKGKIENNLHYTSVYCLDKKTFQRLRAELTQLIEVSRKLALPADEETLACMNLDWFEV